MFTIKKTMVVIGGIIGWFLLDALVLVAVPIIGFLTLCIGLFTRDLCKDEWTTFIRLIRDTNIELFEAIKYAIKN